jgi:hypothetical protein
VTAQERLTAIGNALADVHRPLLAEASVKTHFARRVGSLTGEFGVISRLK